MARIEAGERGGSLTPAQGAQLRKWARDGYVVLERVFPPEMAADVNAEVVRIYEANRHLPVLELKAKFQDLFLTREPMTRAACFEPVLAWIDLILGVRVQPFQSLNLPISSQLGAHSDQILMTTHPPGYMVAAWFALEDVRDDAGPLLLWPGSHRLPALTATQAGLPPDASEEERFRIYDQVYYERIRHVLDSGRFPKVSFAGRLGDVLLWHSNLLHGADVVRREGATRQSYIVHYFGTGVTTYSDMRGILVENFNMRRL